MYRIEGDPSSGTSLLTLQAETAGLQLQGFNVRLAAVTLCHSVSLQTGIWSTEYGVRYGC